MSKHHGTRGGEKFGDLMQALEAADIAVSENRPARRERRLPKGMHDNCLCTCEEVEGCGVAPCDCCMGECEHRPQLRQAHFIDSAGKQIIMEEYLAVDARNCSQPSMIGLAIYEKGHRPGLVTFVLEP